MPRPEVKAGQKWFLSGRCMCCMFDGLCLQMHSWCLALGLSLCDRLMNSWLHIGPTALEAACCT